MDTESLYEDIPVDVMRAIQERKLAGDFIPPEDASDSERFNAVVAFFAYDPNYHFFLEFIQLMQRRPVMDGDRCKTMGVSVKKGNFYLVYNQDFLRMLTIGELRFVLCHEIFHIALHHCTLRRMEDPNMLEWDNIFKDLAINSAIDQFAPWRTADKICIPRVDQRWLTYFGDAVEADQGKPWVLLPGEKGISPPYAAALKKYESYEYYRDNIIPPSNPNGGDGDGDSGDGNEGDPGKSGNGGGNPKSGQFDSHDMWEEDAIASEKVRQCVDRVDSGNMWGSMPAMLQETIRAAQRTQVAWNKLFRFYLGQWGSFMSVETRYRPHKVFGYSAPGHRPDGRDPVCVFDDTSASVSSEHQSLFLAECNSFNRKFGTLFFTEFDVQVHRKPPLRWDRKRNSFDIVGRGGTSFDVIFELFRNKDKHFRMFRHIVILTDGECDYPEIPEGLSVIWVVCPGGKRPDYQESNKLKIVMMN